MKMVCVLVISTYVPLGCVVAMSHENSISLQNDFVTDGTCDEMFRYSGDLCWRRNIKYNIKNSIENNTKL